MMNKQHTTFMLSPLTTSRIPTRDLRAKPPQNLRKNGVVFAGRDDILKRSQSEDTKDAAPYVYKCS